MNKKTSKLLTSLAVGVAAYYVYNQFVAPHAAVSGLGNWRRRQQRMNANRGGYSGEQTPDTFAGSGGGGGYFPGSGYDNSGGYGSYANNYDPRITEQPGGLAAQNAMLDALESGN